MEAFENMEVLCKTVSSTLSRLSEGYGKKNRINRAFISELPGSQTSKSGILDWVTEISERLGIPGSILQNKFASDATIPKVKERERGRGF